MKKQEKSFLIQSGDLIIAIARGGLLPALLLSHKYNIRKIETISVTSYSKKKKVELSLEEKDFKFIKGKNVVLCDDIVDTGETMKSVVRYISKFEPKKVITYAAVVNPNAAFIPDFYEVKNLKGQWVDFCYEKKQNIREYIC